jgi:hypothetical protein
MSIGVVLDSSASHVAVELKQTVGVLAKKPRKVSSS